MQIATPYCHSCGKSHAPGQHEYRRPKGVASVLAAYQDIAPASSNGRTPDFGSGNGRSSRPAGTKPALAASPPPAPKEQTRRMQTLVGELKKARYSKVDVREVVDRMAHIELVALVLFLWDDKVRAQARKAKAQKNWRHRTKREVLR